MPAALAVWAAFAFITWNVVFDRQVYLAGVEFTRQQIQRHARGEPVVPLEAGFRPRVGAAALYASAWGGSVLAAGVLLTLLASRQTTRS